MAAPIVQSSTGGYTDSNASTTTELVLNVPSGTAEGDLLVSIWTSGQGNRYIKDKVGWIEAFNEQNSGSGDRMQVFWRKATASEPASYTFYGSDKWTDVRGTILRITGAADPWVDVPVMARTILPAGATYDLPDATALANESLSIRTAVNDSSGNNIQPDDPTDYTEHTSFGVAGKAWSKEVSSGAIGVDTVNTNHGSRNANHLGMIIKPGSFANRPFFIYGTRTSSAWNTDDHSHGDGGYLEDDDLVLFFVNTDNVSSMDVVPSGFTLLTSYTSNRPKCRIYWKYVTDAASETLPWEWSLNGNDAGGAVTIILRNCADPAVTPIVHGQGTRESSSTSWDSPDITSTDDFSLILRVGFPTQDLKTYPAGTLLGLDAGNANIPAACVAFFMQETAGSTGAVSDWEQDTATTAIGFTLAIAPAPAAGGSNWPGEAGYMPSTNAILGKQDS